jgi:hypothetical protein
MDTVSINPGTTYFYKVKARYYDGLESDLSDYDSGYAQASSVSVTSIQITGPQQIPENSGSQFTCTAFYSNGSSVNVNTSAQWDVDGNYASISNTGYLSTSSVPADQQCQVSATYSENGITMSGDLTITITSSGSGPIHESIEIVSINSDGITQGNDLSHYPSISADGRYVAFVFRGSSLVSEGGNGFDQVLVHDRDTGNTELISKSYTGSLGYGMSGWPSISADGRFVTFHSNAYNLVSGVGIMNHDDYHIYLYDRQLDKATLASRSRNGNYYSRGNSIYPSISADGKYIVFQSDAGDLVAGDTNNASDVFGYNCSTFQIEQISAPRNDGVIPTSGYGSPSSDGRYVAFISNLKYDNSIINDIQHVFVFDRQTPQYELISVGTDNSQANQNCIYPSISGDGNIIVFESKSSNLSPEGSNGKSQVFLRDRSNNRTELISKSIAGGPGDGESKEPSISGDGRFITFLSSSSNLVANDTNGKTDIFVYDRQTDRTTLISKTSSGTQSTNHSIMPSISSNGNFIAFQSLAGLLPNDTNGIEDIYVSMVPNESNTYTLTVLSTPESGVPITISPNDYYGSSNGNSTFTRIYNAGIIVNLTSPSTYNGKIFTHWLIDGQINTSPGIQVTMNNNHTVETVYQTQSMSLQLTSPNGAEQWHRGSTYNITWNSTGIDHVSIYLYKGGSSNPYRTFGSVATAQSYPWSIDLSCEIADDYKILIAASGIEDWSDDYFSIIGAKRTITVEVPNGGETFQPGTTQSITWKATGEQGTLGDVTVYIYKGGVENSNLGTFPVTYQGIPWSIPPTTEPGGDFKVYLDAGSGVDDWSDNYFSIALPPIQCGDSWQPGAVTGAFTEIGYGNFNYVAVGYSGVLATSMDASNWTTRSSGTANHLYGIAHDGTQFAVVGSGGTIITSPNGMDWTNRTSGVSAALMDVAYGNSKFIAAGYYGKILTSADGINWTVQTTGTNEKLQGIAYGNNQYIAVGNNGMILTSPDGTAWTQQSSPITGTINSIAFGGGLFTAVGNSGEILTSADGSTWTHRSSGTAVNLYSVVYGESQFTAVGSGGTILTSGDSVNWTEQTSGAASALMGIVYGNAQLVTVATDTVLYSRCGDPAPAIMVTAPNGGENWRVNTTQAITWDSAGDIDNVKIDYSTDSGNSWTSISEFTENDGSHAWIIPNTPSDNCLVRVSGIGGEPSDSSDGVFSIIPEPAQCGTAWAFVHVPGSHLTAAYGNNTFVSTGSGGTVYTSPGGLHWTEQSSGVSNHLYGIAYDGGQFAAVGSTGTIITSPDGIDWTSRTSGVSAALMDIAHGNARFIAVGYYGKILTSGDGISWTSQTSGTGEKLQGVTYGGSQYVAVGNNGIIITSTDSTAWTAQVSPITTRLTSAGYGGGTFVAAGDNGEIITSSDGVTWTQQASGTSNHLYSVIYADSTFIAAGGGGTILTSANGIDWTSQTSGISTALQGLAYGNSRFLSVGADIALYSTCGSAVPPITVISPNGGETWQEGATETIYWSSTPAAGDVKIEYSIDNGTTWQDVIASTANDGNHDWLIPAEDSSTCLVKISEANGTDFDVSEAVFTIVPFYECGEHWEPVNADGPHAGVAYGNSTFVVVGSSGSVVTSGGGQNWTARDPGTSQHLYDVVFDNSLFAAVGAGGTIITSADGTTWASRTSGVSAALRAVSYGNSTFIAVGYYGKILTSNNGIDWTVQTSGTSEKLQGIAYDGTQFAAVGNNGMILTGPGDGAWTQQTSPVTTHLNDITFGAGTFAAVGANGEIITSPGGVNWTSRTPGTSSALYAVWFDNGLFTAVGGGGTILTSGDGVNWTTQTSGTSTALLGVTYGDSRFMAVGNNTILYSLCQFAPDAAASTSAVGDTGPLAEREEGEDTQDRDGEPVEPTDPAVPLTLLTPNGGETLTAGEPFLVTWESMEDIASVKLEYSPDNGSTFLTIRDRIPNTGRFGWTIPYHVSANCLVRVSDSGHHRTPATLTYEMTFTGSGSYPQFTLWLGDAANPALKPFIPAITVFEDTDGSGGIEMNGTVKSIHALTGTQPHRLKATLNLETETLSLWLDDAVIFEELPLNEGFTFSPAVSIEAGTNQSENISVEMLRVTAFDTPAGLFCEDFEQWQEGPMPEHSGWVILKTGENHPVPYLSTGAANGSKALNLGGCTAIKYFSMPLNYPFDTSDKPFKINGN